MRLLSAGWAEVGYVLAAVGLVLGLTDLASPRAPRRGVWLGAAGALLAVAVTLGSQDLDHLVPVLIAIAVGAVAAVPSARLVAVTRLPRLVALGHGLGGAAIALVALLELVRTRGEADRGTLTAIVVVVVAGAVACAGAAVVAGGRRVDAVRAAVRPLARPLLVGGLVAVAAAAVAVVVTGLPVVGIVLLLLGLGFGALVALAVGPADVPILVPMLHVLTGPAVAAVGFVLQNTVLVVAGALVGAGGLALTRSTAAAGRRTVAEVLPGAGLWGPSGSNGAGGAGDRVPDRPVRAIGPEDAAILLGRATSVIVVPGYGLAVAQAQHLVRVLADALVSRGTDVRFAVHPAAGRMPGHLGVLLASAGVPPRAIEGPDEANPRFATTDVALVVGANDVVNPAATDDPAAPIHGMPVLRASAARQVVVLERSMRPGHAGIENALFRAPGTSLVLGDIGDSLAEVLAAVRAL